VSYAFVQDVAASWHHYQQVTGRARRESDKRRQVRYTMKVAPQSQTSRVRVRK
jgi:hypothetical protein